MLDIAEEAVRAADREDMLGQVLRYADLLQGSLDGTRSLEAALPRTPRRILVVGMGGSAISGDYLGAWLDHEGDIPLAVCRQYQLPSWVDPETLVLAFSYSGATEETLAAFSQARQKGAMLAAVATGNRLEELARSYDAPFVAVGGGMQPRAALPRMFAAGAILLDRLGLLSAEKPLAAAVSTLGAMAADLGPSAPASRNEAKRVALALQDTVPVVYASDVLAPAARRFANELSENSKVLAFHGAMPELTHNELVAWAGDDDLDRFTAIFLRHSGEHAQARARYDFTARLIQERGGRVVQLEARGDSAAERLLSASMAGDAVSIYLAALRKVDPSPVDVIKRLKARMTETGFASTIR